MTYLLDSLAEAGLVERRPDPADRRARRIVATARGRVLLDGLGERLREVEDQVLAGLDEAGDRQAFRTLLQRLALHAATALDSASADPCTVGPAPAPEDC
jgi:DNA-binding MarR family transcriptional regulator